MAKTIGQIAVAIVARTEKLAAQLGVARRLVAGFKSSVMISTKVMAAFSATATAAGVALAYMVNKQAEYIDESGKLADELGASTQGLEALRHAAGLAGADSETLTTGLRRMQKTLGDAQRGNATAAAAFNRLGLSISSLQNVDAVQAFGMIADAINKLPNAAQRAAASQEIFGRGAGKLSAIIAGGTDAIRQATEETNLMGTAFSRIDARMVEAANDQWHRMQELLRGIVVQLTIALAPIIKATADAMFGIGTAAGGMKGVVNAAFDSIIDTVQVLMEQVQGLIQSLTVLMTIDFSKLLEGAFSFESDSAINKIRENFVKAVEEATQKAQVKIPDFKARVQQARADAQAQAILDQQADNERRRRAAAGGRGDVAASAISSAFQAVLGGVRAVRGIVPSFDQQRQERQQRAPVGPQFADALVQGTQEAFVAARRNLFGGTNEPVKKTADNTGKSVKELVRSNDTLNRILTAFEKFQAQQQIAVVEAIF